MSTAVRQATIDDAEIFARLNVPIQQLHADAMPHIFKQAGVTDALIDHFRGVLTSPETVAYVAEVDGVPAGYMVCIIRIVPENPFSYARRILVIDNLSVNPEFQRRGVGKLLINVARTLAAEQNLTRITLDVWDFNQGAQVFYREQGFEMFVQRLQLLPGL